MIELPPNAEYYTYRAKSGVEREGKLKEFLRRDSKCDQMSKSDSSSTPYWKASIQKDHLHSECQSICFFFYFLFFSHVHAIRQCKWSTLRVSIQV